MAIQYSTRKIVKTSLLATSMRLNWTVIDAHVILAKIANDFQHDYAYLSNKIM